MNPKDTSLPRRLPAARPRRRAGRALLTGVTAAALAALGPLPQAAHADGAGEAVVAPLHTEVGPLGSKIVAENADGYLMQSAERYPDRSGDPRRYTWKSADGTVTRDIGVWGRVPFLVPKPGGGGTILAASDSLSGESPFGYYDPAAGVWLAHDTTAPGPGDTIAFVPNATGYAVLKELSVPGKPVRLYLVQVDSTGSHTAVPVSGQPLQDAGPARFWRAVNGAMMIGYGWSDGTARLSLINTNTAAMTFTEDWDRQSAPDLVMNDHAFGFYAPSTGRLTTRSIDDPQTVATDMTVTPPAGATDAVLTDSALVLGEPAAGVRLGETPGSVTAFPLDGSASTVLSTNASSPLATVDGGVLYDAGNGSGGWATYKVPVDGGPVSVVRTLTTYHAQTIGLSLDRGRLTRVESTPGYTAGEYLEAADLGTGAVPAPPAQIQHLAWPMPDYTVRHCDGLPCRPLMATDSAPDSSTFGFPDYLSTAEPYDEVRQVGSSSVRHYAAPVSADSRIVSADGDDVVYDPGSAGVPPAAAALWNRTRWTATSTPGTFTVTQGSATSTLTTDAPCVPDEIQVLGHWLYWSCGESGPAGVYDTTTHHSVPVPAGKALLGDGFVLRHAGGSLVLTDVHTGTATDRTLAAMPAGPFGDDRGITWTVDKFSDFVAYTGADGATHVLPSGVPASPLHELRGTIPQSAAPSSSFGWQPQWTLARPVASWRVDIRRRGHDTVVASFGGGEARSTVSGKWDGTDTSGHEVLYGLYDWTLYATPSAGGDSAPAMSGTVLMMSSRGTAHDYTGDAVGDLLALTAGGRLDVRPGTGTSPGNVRYPSASGSGWPSSSLLIPFGDMNGDDVKDLLVRDAAGRLTVYYGTTGRSFSPSGPHQLIGGGWNMFNLLTSPSDLNGDVRPDLLARDAHGDLWLYETVSAGKFTRRTKVGYGYQIYDLIAGSPVVLGYPTEVKSGNMFARDRSGVLWCYPSNPDDTRFGPRIRVGGGWNIYTSIVGVGDLDGDGRNDLVARDSAGVLWFYAQKGYALAPRVRMGGGWNMYKSLL